MKRKKGEGFLGKEPLRFRDWKLTVDAEMLFIKKEDFEIKLDINKILSVYFDRTDFEASYNEFRLEDYYEGLCNNSYESVEMSIEFLKVISNRLKDKFPYYNFHIVRSEEHTSELQSPA